MLFFKRSKGFKGRFNFLMHFLKICASISIVPGKGSPTFREIHAAIIANPASAVIRKFAE